VICGEEGLEEVGEDGEIHSIFGGSGMGECRTFMERDVREWRKKYIFCV